MVPSLTSILSSLPPSIRNPSRLLCTAVLLQGLLHHSGSPTVADAAAVSGGPGQSTHIEGSRWYDWGWYGAYPQVTYESFGSKSPWPNLARTDPRCHEDYIFIGPRGKYVDTPGPIILDNGGNLIWTDPQWGQAMDVKVQKFQGKDHITFWHGSDNGTFGEGHYLMLDETYDVVKKVLPVGGLTGDLHEFRILENDNALMTIYQKIQIDMPGFGISNGWIYDSLFQEVDLVTGELIFEWRASDHFAVEESMALLGSQGKTADSAFDYFHINSIDKDADGNYIVSSRYLCAIMCVNGTNGETIWHLGGDGNQFKDLSDGRATDFTWNHHAAWYKERNATNSTNPTLTVFDNGSNGDQTNAKHSRGLMIEIDVETMSATLVQAYVSPQKLLVPSQGSVQVLPNDNVLVGWGHTPAWTEFSIEGEVLCDTHISSVWFANFSWVKNYRTFKYAWTGRPRKPPMVAMRPKQNAVFASWNGATEVGLWQLQSADDPDADDNEFQNHGSAIKKSTFETRIQLPDEVDDYVRVMALTKEGRVLGYSDVVPKWEHTMIELMEAPSRGAPMEPGVIFALSFAATVITVLAMFFFRSSLRKGFNRVISRSFRRTHGYQPVPMK